MRNSSILSAAALSFPLVAGCAGHARPAIPSDPAAREALLLTRHDLAPGRRCDIIDPGVALPALETVVDTAAVPDYMRQAGVSVNSGYALFSIRYDSTGTPVRARLIDATFADSLARPMEVAMGSALMPRPAGAPLAARLRIDFSPARRYRLGKSSYCEPQMLAAANRDPRSTLLPRGPVGSRSVRSYKFEVSISATGEVEGVRFLPPQDPALEDAVRASAARSHWKPALDDGIPVSSRATETGTVETQVQGRVVPRP